MRTAHTLHLSFKACAAAGRCVVQPRTRLVRIQATTCSNPTFWTLLQ
ncbi:hypothetical protein [Neisseria sp.]